MICNVILDWSGTLVDDLAPVLEATNYVLAKAGRPIMSLDQFRAEFCLPFTLFYARYTPDVPIEQLERWFHAYFRKVRDCVAPLPHARQFLEFCRANSVRTFVLSTVKPAHFKVQLEQVGFGDLIGKTYLGVRDKRVKIAQVLRANKLAPDQTMFVGDMQHDIDAAKAGGVISCAVLTGYNTVEQLEAAGPDMIVRDLEELRGILERTTFDPPLAYRASNTAQCVSRSDGDELAEPNRLGVAANRSADGKPCC